MPWEKAHGVRFVYGGGSMYKTHNLYEFCAD